MDVELAEQRLLLIPERVGGDEAEARACARRAEAFGTVARLSGLLGRGREETVELVYRERRLQPFWRIACRAVYAYERVRRHTLVVGEEVQAARIGDVPLELHAGGRMVAPVHETCRQETLRAALYDGLTGKEAPSLAAYLDFGPQPSTTEALAAVAEAGCVVAPPAVRASALVRELVAGLIGRIDADVVHEERVEVQALELIYRPVHAFRFRRGDRSAVVEVDGLTGAVRTDGATFEHLLGRVLDPAFLLDVGVETAALFVPGARLAQIVVSKGVATHKALTKR